MRRAPSRTPRRALLAALAACALTPALARAADVETRHYSVTVDGKKAGDYQLTIHHADGTTTVSARSDVCIRVLGVPVYTYSYQAQEVWKGGRLQRFGSAGKEKGKEFAVRAELDGQSLRVVVNGQERRVRPDVWTTSCWHLPPAQYRNNAVTLLGCDTGADKATRLEYVGPQQLKVAGQEQTCTRYRVTKDAPHDLWYDAQERLVRDEWVTDGHRTVLELTAVQRQ